MDNYRVRRIVLDSSVISLEGLPDKVGSLYLDDVDILTSLKGIPKEIDKLTINGAENLKVLDYMPEVIYRDIEISYTSIKRLDNFPKLAGNSKITLYSNILESLEGLPEEVPYSLLVSDNSLKNLKGCPKRINGDFNISFNPLETLEYFPEYVKGSVYFRSIESPLYQQYTNEELARMMAEVCEIDGYIYFSNRGFARVFKGNGEPNE